MRILNGIYDVLVTRMFDRHRHTDACQGCPACEQHIDRELKARAEYQAELDRVFG